MRWANKLGARWVVLLLADGGEPPVVALNEMASGKQVEVPWEDLPARLA